MRFRFKTTALLLILTLLASLLCACAVPAQQVQTPSAGDSLVLIETTPAPKTESAQASDLPAPEPAQDPTASDLPDPDGSYTSAEDVARYLLVYGYLPSNFITKREAQAAGWTGGSLEPYCPGKCIGGDRFGNREGLLPDAPGRTWTECDINTLGARSRGAERLVFSNDGLIYYTGDHYDSFQLLYGNP